MPLNESPKPIAQCCVHTKHHSRIKFPSAASFLVGVKFNALLAVLLCLCDPVDDLLSGTGRSIKKVKIRITMPRCKHEKYHEVQKNDQILLHVCFEGAFARHVLLEGAGEQKCHLWRLERSL